MKDTSPPQSYRSPDGNRAQLPLDGRPRLSRPVPGTVSPDGSQENRGFHAWNFLPQTRLQEPEREKTELKGHRAAAASETRSTGDQDVQPEATTGHLTAREQS